ncbi:hypothetical protein DPMN_042979 [Dreissena polymorpha]|uniref:Uncharacterized protein n=1 Tax=Dreissena polymorpha TaxID=45954 RepID=A0A9D4D1X6_DREPO|nr:hypothetical protein DPMN_042979 [Dreissena polymorpha]
MSAGGVAVYRDSAGTLPAFTGLSRALPATTGSIAGTLPVSPGHNRDNRGFAGLHRDKS